MQLQPQWLGKLHYNYTFATTQLHLQYTTLHPAAVGEVTIATIATIRTTQLQPLFRPLVDSPCPLWFTATNFSYRFPFLLNFRRRLGGYSWYIRLILLITKPALIPWNDRPLRISARISGKDLAIRLNGSNGLGPGSTPTWIEVTVVGICWFCFLSLRATPLSSHEWAYMT